MTSHRTTVFNRLLREVTRPRLAALGFHFDGSRTFRRPRPGTDPVIVQIINFQLGQRSLEGRFTCNLAVYHAAYGALPTPIPPATVREEDCAWELRRRLGFLRRRKPFLTALFERLFGPRDYWWRVSTDEVVLRGTLETVTEELMGPGLEWLTARSSVAACAEAAGDRG